MKNIRKVIYALIVLNLVVDAAFLVLAPDQVAVHFGASGEADRIGSKYEHLWFPALALAFGLGLPFIAKRSDAHDGDKLLKADVVLLALMAVFSLFVFADGLSSSGSPFAALDLNVGRGAALVAGIAFVICGNIMPKSDRNEAFGLRTPWSLSNDEVWRKSQRFGGYAMIASGVLTVVAGLALPMNLVMPGLDGLKKMADLMAGLREQPPAEIAGVAVKQQKDYKDGSVVETATGARSQMELTGSNVLRYEMADGTSLIVRPSGTEPKVKVYILANGASRAECDEKVAKYAAWAESLRG